MRTTQTRQPFLTPAARSRPQLFCRDSSTGELLWSRDDGLNYQTHSDWQVQFPGSCGRQRQEGGNVYGAAGNSSPGFVHEHQGLVLLITSAGDLITCDADGNSRSLYRNAFGQQFYGAIAASDRTVWVNIENNLVAVDIIDGIQSTTPMSAFSPFYSLVHPDGSIVVADDSGSLSAWQPNGSLKWGPISYPTSEVGFYWGSFLNGDMVTASGVISASTGSIIATWPEGRGKLGSTNTNAPDLADIVIWQNEKVLTHLWVKEWVQGFGPDDGFWENYLYFSELDRNLKIVREEKMPTDNWPDYSRIPDPWFLYDLELKTEGAVFYPNSEHLVGSWLSDLTLPDPVSLPIALGPPANKKRSDLNEYDYRSDPPSVLRHASGFFCTLFGDILASFDTSGQLRWQVALPDGPQRGITNYVLSDDGSKIYYIG